MNAAGAHLHRLTYNRQLIVDDVDSRHVVNHLIAQGVLDVDDDEEIRAERTRKDKVELLIEKVTEGGPDAYKHFREALGDNYQHIVVKLDATPMDAGNYQRGDAFVHKGSNIDMKFAERNKGATKYVEVKGDGNFVLMADHGSQINFNNGRKPQDYM
ncbi:uncharacterized protein [Amphiura filiformis]|uniref:uncharacterized protein n=1 Tax=Amphiura filiformis TaxID=82378 RepID=UPI003B2158EA